MVVYANPIQQGSGETVQQSTTFGPLAAPATTQSVAADVATLTLAGQTPTASTVAPIVVQEGFRWRNDDGSETSATWAAAQDTNASLALATNVRLRVLLDATGDPPPTPFTLYYKKTSDSTWLPVPVGPGFDPMSISGMTAWYDASDTATITASGGSVSQWNDKSGLNRHVSQATSGNRPVTGSNTINGRNVIRFDGTDDYLATSGSVQIVNASTGAFSVFAVAKLITVLTNTNAIVGQDGGGAGTRIFQVRNDAGGYNFILFDTTKSPTFEGNGSWVLNAVTMVSGVRTATDAEIWKDGATNGPTTTSGTPESASMAMGVGMVNGNFWQGDIAEVILYNRALTTTERQNVESYLTGKWTGGGGGLNPVYVAASSNITAGGEATTAQLTPPAGKTTAGFSVGRMWDDENGTDSVDIGAVPFTPTTLSGLTGWWDATDAASFTFSSGSVVSQWNDKSSSGYHVSQATTGNQPTRSGTINGVTAVTFDGSNDVLRRTNAPVNNSSDGSFSVFAVIKPSSLSGDNSIVDADDPDFGKRISQYLRTTGTNGESITFDTGGNPYFATGSTTLSTATAYIFCSTCTGTTVTLYINGTSVGSSGQPNQKYSAAVALGLGALCNNNAQFFPGDIGEVITYSRVLTSTERGDVTTYLQAKWGI